MVSKRWQKRIPTALLAGTALGTGALALTSLRGNAGPQNTTPPVQPTAQVLNIQDAFEKVADKLRPSVVYIRSRQTITNTALRGGDDENQFGFALPQVPGGRQFRAFPQAPSVRRAEASGSGVIVSSDGYILTNDHVVAGADRVTVRLQDGHELVGKVFRDQRSDLALIKVEASNLPAAEFANSDSVKVGQWALAFGSPFGLNDTMTVGVVSSTKRHEQIGGGADSRLYPSLIQTDASINPGNSGGPLVDVYGRIMGINVAIESPSGGNVGIGFAIPSNQARYIMEQLRSKGTVTRGYLGFVPQSLTYDMQQRYGVKEGALIVGVQMGTPAAQAGLQVEDVVVRYNGQPVTDEATLRELVSRTAPGKQVQLVVKREGAEKTLTATIGASPVDKTAAADPTPAREHAKGKLGISLGNAADAQTREAAHLSNAIKEGVVVVEVLPGSPASDADLHPGDVLVRLNGKTVTSTDQVSDIAAKLNSGASVPVVLKRAFPDGTIQTVLANINIE